MRSHAFEQCSQKNKVFKLQQTEVMMKNQCDKNIYIVEVNMKGNSCGQIRVLCLTCLRDRSQDVHFGVNNYNAHNIMLLNTKHHGEPQARKPLSLKNVEDIMNNISRFIHIGGVRI